MSTRTLIAALLMTSACVAHADVLPSSSSTQPNFLSTWTTGNGADVVGSGVLANNVSLVGGIAYGSDSKAAQALYQQASASVGASGGGVQLSYAQGIQGTYVLGTSNAAYAAMLGNGVSVASSANGVVVTTGATGSANVGTSSSQLASAGAGGGGQVGAGAGVSLPPVSGLGNNAGTGSGSGSSSASDSASGTGSVSGKGGVVLGSPAQSGPIAQPADAALPEPSSIALMAIGLFGAAGLRRRHK